MAFYQIISEQILCTSMDKAWEFLSNPGNLQLITPGHLHFKIRNKAENQMYPGQIIMYRVTPFPGYSTQWVTEITQVRHGEYFVDEQRFGPYRFWHHKHFLSPVDGGVLMRDVVDYSLPLGILGRMAHRLLVRGQLWNIFRYREKALEKHFGLLPDNPPTLLMRRN